MNERRYNTSVRPRLTLREDRHVAVSAGSLVSTRNTVDIGVGANIVVVASISDLALLRHNSGFWCRIKEVSVSVVRSRGSR